MRDIERLLAAAAGPGSPLDLDDVRRRATRQRAARAGVVVAACSAVALVAGGLAVGGGTRDASLDVVATTPPPATVPPTTEPPTAEPTTRPPRTHSVTTPPPPPPTTTPSPTQWPWRETARDGDLTATVSVADPVVPAGTDAVFTVTANDTDGDPYASVRWGDGTQLKGGHFGVMCEGIGEYPPSSRPLGESLSHAFRKPGRYVVRVTVTSSHPCGKDIPVEEVSFDVPITVTAGDAPSNGATKPTAYLELDEPMAYEDAPTPVVVSIDALDPDGYVATATIDFGDGTKQVLRNDRACDDGGGARFPRDGGLRAEVPHEYAEDKEYELTLTFTSTGCDGKDPQRATYTHVWNRPL